MEMSEKEIIKSFEEAKDRNKQIRVLADLNGCPRDQIVEILSAAGVYKKPGKKPAKKEEIFVSKNVGRLLTENLDNIEDSIRGMEQELYKMQEAIRIRKQEYEEYIVFLKTVKTKGEENEQSGDM